MDDQLNAAIQNLNPDIQLPEANQQPDEAIPVIPVQDPAPRNVNIDPRRSDREPLYSDKYLQYRARLLEGDGTDSSVESESSYGTSSSDWTPGSLSSEDDDFDVAMSAVKLSLHDHDPATLYNPVSILLLEPYIPVSFKDAISCQDSHHWIPAIEDEFASIMENNTWTLEPLPSGRKAIKCKWVMDFKPGHKGVDPRYKARLVACGYDQLYGIDYLATYSPVVKHHSIRLVLGIVAAFDLDLMQLDVKTSFLYGQLEETIYMRQPEGFVVPGKEEHVCKLQRPIYGLKQAANCWNSKFNKFLIDFGFVRFKYDLCVYFRIRPDGEYTILIIYVDDGLACSNRPHILAEILDYLSRHFKSGLCPQRDLLDSTLSATDQNDYFLSTSRNLCSDY